MRLVNRLGVLIIALAILVPVSVDLAGQEKGNPKGERVDTKNQHGKNDKNDKNGKNDKNDKKDKRGKPIQSVPEPATFLLLGVGAGVAAAHKVWLRRRSRTKTSTSTTSTIS